MDLYFRTWVFCHLKNVQGSKSEMWKSQIQGPTWASTLCLQQGVKGLEVREHRYVMRPKAELTLTLILKKI